VNAGFVFFKCSSTKMEEGNELSCTPPEIADVAKKVTLNLLPENSRHKYEKQYDFFIAWCNLKKVKRYTENVIVYFSEKAKTMKSSTLWSMYSMLRSVLSVKNNIDISQYKKLIAFLKQQSVGYNRKKSKTFTKEEILKFLFEAPDEIRGHYM
jgi:tRNA 2-selenouridine synthase SelU